MTTDGISEMGDIELNAEIAKAHGWYQKCSRWYPPDHDKSGNPGQPNPPAYSTEWSEAGPLLEEMVGDIGYGDIGYDGLEGGWWSSEAWTGEDYSYASTPTRAIAECWLRQYRAKKRREYV